MVSHVPWEHGIAGSNPVTSTMDRKNDSSQDASKECPYCKEGKPTRLQAIGFGGTLKPVHDVGEYPYFEWCKLGGYP